MSKNGNDPDRVQEPHATYRVPKRVKNRRAIERAIRIQDELFERHAGQAGTAPDSVQIIRAGRDRKTMDKAIKFIDQFQKRHAGDKADKDVVTLVCEERER